VREPHHESLLRQAFIGIVTMVAVSLSTSPRSGVRPKRRWLSPRRSQMLNLRRSSEPVLPLP